MLVAEGRLVLGDGADWEAWSPQAAATPGRVICVDLSAVTDIDAAGVGLLVRLAVQARCHGRELAIVAASPWVRQVLELVQLDRIAGFSTSRMLIDRGVLNPPYCGLRAHAERAGAIEGGCHDRSTVSE